MTYLAKVRGGYLWRGRIVKDAAQAATYTSPSAAARAIGRAVAAGMVERGKVVPVQGANGSVSAPAKAAGGGRQRAVLTEAEFGVIAKLSRSSAEALARTAAFQVLVEGRAVKDVVVATGLSQPAVSQAARRYREAHAVILTGYARCK